MYVYLYMEQNSYIVPQCITSGYVNAEETIDVMMHDQGVRMSILWGKLS